MGDQLMVGQDRPFEIQPRANRAMALMLQAAAIAALVLGVVGALLPGTPGRVTAWAAFGVVSAVPLLRVLWLGVRWVERRDVRFAVLAFTLLAVVLLGAVAAALQNGS